MTFAQISQILIPVLTVTYFFMLAKKNRWGFAVGLAAQPFWLYSSAHSKQWGIFVTTIFVIASQLLGIYEWFYKTEKGSE